jgi:hypothetical protein
MLLAKYAGSKSAEEFIRHDRYNAEMYRKYKEYYGYAFYIAKKVV